MINYHLLPPLSILHLLFIIIIYSAASNWCTDFRIVSHEIFSIELARVSQAKQFASHTFIIWCHKVSKYLVMWNYVPHFTTYLHATWLSWHRCSEFALIISVVSGSRNYFKLISVNLFRICASHGSCNYFQWPDPICNACIPNRSMW